MEKNLPAIAVTIAFSLLGVVGDYFLKVASVNENSALSRNSTRRNKGVFQERACVSLSA
jgi:hypothetical protein